MRGKHRIVKRVLLAIVALLAVLLVVATVALGPIVKKAVEAAGPSIAGVPMQVESVRIYPLRGTARINGLVVGAPSGFKSNLAELHQFRMKLRLGSLFTDTLVIEEIVIRGPIVTYELAGLRSNVGSLLEALRGDGERPTSAKDPGKKGKKVIIDHFLFEDGKVRLATTLTGGRGVVLPLPKIEMRDVGRRQDGVSALEAFRDTVVVVSVAVLTTVRDGVVGIAGLGADTVSAIASSAGSGLLRVGDLAGDAAMAIGSLTVDGVKAAGSFAGKGAQAVGGLAVDGARAVGDIAGQGARAAGDLAVDGARAVGDIAGQGARAAGDLAGEGARAVGGALRSVGGLFGGKPDEKPEEESEEKAEEQAEESGDGE